MRRLTRAVLAAALSLSMLAFAPVVTEDDEDTTDTSTEETSTEETTEEEPTLFTPEPDEVTLYFHGAGDRFVDEDQWLAGPPPMDRNAPTSDEFESKQLTNYLIGPNHACAGNGLWPVWVGYVGGGTIVGDATLTIDVAGATGGDVVVNIWTDVSGPACNEAYPEPDATATVALPVGAGTLEVAVPTDGLAPEFQLMVQLQPPDDAPGELGNPTSQARVFYDSADFPGSISFTCQPHDVETEEEAATADCDPMT